MCGLNYFKEMNDQEQSRQILRSQQGILTRKMVFNLEKVQERQFCRVISPDRRLNVDEKEGREILY
jgi:hypothetical protein